MKVKVIGVKLVDYTNKQGKPVKGLTLYCVKTEKSETTRGEEFFDGGRYSSGIWVGIDNPEYETLKNIPLGSMVEVYYNQFGSVGAVHPCK